MGSPRPLESTVRNFAGPTTSRRLVPLPGLAGARGWLGAAHQERSGVNVVDSLCSGCALRVLLPRAHRLIVRKKGSATCVCLQPESSDPGNQPGVKALSAGWLDIRSAPTVRGRLLNGGTSFCCEILGEVEGARIGEYCSDTASQRPLQQPGDGGCDRSAGAPGEKLTPHRLAMNKGRYLLGPSLRAFAHHGGARIAGCSRKTVSTMSSGRPQCRQMKAGGRTDGSPLGTSTLACNAVRANARQTRRLPLASRR